MQGRRGVYYEQTPLMMMRALQIFTKSRRASITLVSPGWQGIGLVQLTAI